MNFRSIIIGIAASAILLVVLVIARLFVVDMKVPTQEIREIETATIAPPPPPPPPEEPLLEAPPPPPSLTTVSSLPDLSRVPIPQAQIPMDITAPVENFSTDLAPAPLPLAPTPPRPSPRVRNPGTAKSSPARGSTAPPVVKSFYDANELDGMPRVLRHGSTNFPRALSRKGVHRGAVVLEIEISATGSVTLRRVVSVSAPELAAPARRVASGARFTPPKKNGKPVKAIVHWPIVIEE